MIWKMFIIESRILSNAYVFIIGFWYNLHSLMTPSGY